MDILISGSSTGIGRASAVHLARLGHSVWAGVREQKSFDNLTKLNVRGLQPVFLDVTDSQSIALAVSSVKKHSGMLHALVNNAGIGVGGPIEGLELSAWRRQLDTNFFGLVDLTKTCLPLLRESRGRILNISSIMGRIAMAYAAPYSVSKFAVEAFSDCLRREMRRFGVRVCVIEPGPIQTPIWEKSEDTIAHLRATLSKDVLELYGDSLEKYVKSIQAATRRAAPVALVVRAVEHALTSSRPKSRYPVGPGIGLASRAANVLPDAWLDRLLR